jgi:hypothetical protein
MSNEVTLFITSCGRPHLLKITLESFIKYNSYPIKEAIICEDSGVDKCIDFAKDILKFPCKIIYNKKRIGQMRSIENGVKYITTPYVFHCEDDWEFYCSGFIELSMQILESNDKIAQVLLRSYNEYVNMYNFKIIKSENIYRQITLSDSRQIYSFNPSLKKTDIQMLNIPYEDWDDEFTIQNKINELGMFAVVTNNVNGFVSHIGWNNHIEESNDITYRSYFPGK